MSWQRKNKIKHVYILLRFETVLETVDDYVFKILMRFLCLYDEMEIFYLSFNVCIA